MPQIRLRDYCARIAELIQASQHDLAVAHCQHILSHYPKHIETICLLGQACLGKGMTQLALGFFQRTLSSDPENVAARMGLAAIHAEEDRLPEAVWQMEQAYELVPGDSRVRRELQELYAERYGESPDLKLTRGGLGRLYARNGLNRKAIAEFRALLQQDPDLPHIQVALAEALWGERRRVEAVEVCLDLLDALPNCLKANLILGEIWLRSGHEEAGKQKLELARALDPENTVAQLLMGSNSPLTLQEIVMPLLEAAAEESPREASAQPSTHLLDGSEADNPDVDRSQSGTAAEPGELRATFEPEGGESVIWTEPFSASGPRVHTNEPGSVAELPDWLLSLADQDPAPPDESGPMLPDQELATLQDPESNGPAVEKEPAERVQASRGDAKYDPEDLPEWLRELMASEAFEPEASVAEPLPGLAAAEQAGEQPGRDAEVPEWVREMHEIMGQKASWLPNVVPWDEAQAPESQPEAVHRQLDPAPADPDALIELARRCSAEGDWDRALDHYEDLIKSGVLLPQVIAELRQQETMVEDRVRLYLLIGDAHRQAGQLEQALGSYRRAGQSWMERQS